jgi:hypothetical protein
MTKKTIKNTVFALLSFCTIATAFAFTWPQGWVPFESKEFRFKIAFPAAPELTSQLANTALGAMTLHIAQLDVSGDSSNSNLVYMVNYTQFPDSINSDRKDRLERFFNGSINSMVKNVQGTLLSQKEIDYKGYPGREIQVNMQGQATITAKLILIKKKYFNIMVMTSPKKEYNADMAKFFDSFEGE